MKRMILTALALLALTGTASAATVGLAWDAVNEADGYNVYVDGALYQPVAATTASVETTPGKHTFYVTATNSWGESAPSNTVTTPWAAGIPGNLRMTITIDVATGAVK